MRRVIAIRRRSSPAQRAAWTAAAAIALVLRVFAIAAAHATLVSSEPAAGTHLASAPARLRLVFSEPIEPSMAQVSLASGDGKTVTLSAAGDPRDVHAVIAPVGNGVANGPAVYRVAWHVVSADGHPVSGSFVFSVGGSDSIPVSGGPPPPDVPPPPDISVWGPAVANAPMIPALLRGIGVGCLLALGGLLLFIVSTGASTGRPVRIAMLLSVAAPVFIGAHLGTWLLNASPNHRLDAAWLSSALGSTVGRVELWRTGLSLLPLWGLGLARRPGVALALTAPAILLSAAVGHSAAIHPLWAIPFKALHLIAIAVWIGGLVWLLARERDRGVRTASEIGRVSTVALWAVVLVTLSGVVQTLILLRSFEDFRSPYGTAVLAKIAGLVILIVFGIYNRALIRRIRRGGGDGIDRLQASVSRELVVFGAVMIVGGVLAYLSPPAQRGTPAQHSTSEISR